MLSERYNAATSIDANLTADRGAKTAIYFGDEQITYDDLHRRICAMGRALRAYGVTREDRVLLILNDTPVFPVAFFGAMRIGAVPVPVNPLYKAIFLQSVCASLRPSHSRRKRGDDGMICLG